MKTIGLLGGMSWESTQTYYRLINEGVRAQRGGLTSARVVMVSVEFAEIERYQRSGQWELAAERLIEAAGQIQQAGASFLVICSNTMHKVAAQIERAVELPLLHIVDATADRVHRAGHDTVGLLGTRFTMEETFYVDRLRERHGLRVLVPPAAERELVDRVIFDELCVGRICDDSRATFLRVMEELSSQGAEAIVAGCTEIGLLIPADAAKVPLFDTATIHAEAAVARALT